MLQSLAQQLKSLGVCLVLASCSALVVSAAQVFAETDSVGKSRSIAVVEPCSQVGTWVDPSTRQALDPVDLFASLATRSVVLLGESHDNAEDHRWQLYTATALYSRNPDMAIGFEMFPRSVQPALDRWVAGELDEQAFLQATRWDEVWGYDPELYLPLFHFARQHRIPMIALNVKRSLVSRVGQEGWAAVPVSEREGVTEPAPISADYRRWLAEIYLTKAQTSHSGGQRTDPGVANEWSEEQITQVFADLSFQHFVEAQSTWDRAMAEALAAVRKERDASLAIGIIGRGHVRYGHGVAHQLAALHISDVVTLLPFEATAKCEGLASGISDAAFMVAAWSPSNPPRPLLGVMIEASDDGARVTGVVPDSVAAAAGIEKGDVITQAAGMPTRKTSELITIVQRQAPGTWLPLRVKRGDETLEIIAKFPVAFYTVE